MITSFDDYCIHQTALPVAEPSQSDRNFYDRYWFNGIEKSGDGWMFEIGFGLYPNRRVMDGHFSVSIDDRQHAFHASRRAPKERRDTVIGPLSVEIVEPMRRVRVRLEPNEHDIECDLLFTAWVVGAPLLIVAATLRRRSVDAVRTALWYAVPSLLFAAWFWPIQGLGEEMDRVVAAFPGF